MTKHPDSTNAVLVFTACLFVYMLSIGPVMRLEEKKIIPQSADIVFIPVYIVAYAIPGCYSPINSYLNLWGVDLD